MEAISSVTVEAEKEMVMVSVLAGIVGVLGSGLAAVLLPRWTRNPSPGKYWLFGLAALFPAWLISILSVLGELTDRGSETPLPPSVILSSSAALLGVIVTDWAVRRLNRNGSARSPKAYWLLGVIAFIPAWAIAVYFLP